MADSRSNKRIFEFWRRGRDGSTEKVLTMYFDLGVITVEGDGKIAAQIFKDLERPQTLLHGHSFDPKDPSHLERLPEIFSGSYFWAAEMEVDSQGNNTGLIHPRYRK